MSSDEGVSEKIVTKTAREDGGDGTGEKKKVLFLCTANSARSQMVEGILKALYGDRYQAYSAGVEATAVDPRAVSVMREMGIDISGQRSKSAEELGDVIFDLAITVCDRAKQACPICSADLDSRRGDPGHERSSTRASPIRPSLLVRKTSSLRLSGGCETR